MLWAAGTGSTVAPDFGVRAPSPISSGLLRLNGKAAASVCVFRSFAAAPLLFVSRGPRWGPLTVDFAALFPPAGFLRVLAIDVPHVNESGRPTLESS